jgi:hypothetical protein
VQERVGDAVASESWRPAKVGRVAEEKEKKLVTCKVPVSEIPMNHNTHAVQFHWMVIKHEYPRNKHALQGNQLL